jgi:hypothetical protein
MERWMMAISVQNQGALRPGFSIAAAMVAGLICIGLPLGFGQQPVPAPKPTAAGATQQPLPPLPDLLQEMFKGATPLNPEKTVALDVANKRVVLRTEVACPDCVLEMVLVPEGNREHETILRIRSRAFVIHGALLALGLEPGKPAQFTPEFVAPTGPVIEIEAHWVDSEGKLQKARIQEWVRGNTHRYHSAPLPGPPPGLQMPYKELRWDKFNNEILWYGQMSEEDRDDLLTKWKNADYQKAIRKFYEDGQSRPMKADFVFAGSSMYKDEETGQEIYQAEGGHLICTSNFGDAMIDIREESSASDGAQTYEGWKEKIPKQGTPVVLVLTPQKNLPANGKNAVEEKSEPRESEDRKSSPGSK